MPARSEGRKERTAPQALTSSSVRLIQHGGSTMYDGMCSMRKTVPKSRSTTIDM